MSFKDLKTNVLLIETDIEKSTILAKKLDSLGVGEIYTIPHFKVAKDYLLEKRVDLIIIGDDFFETSLVDAIRAVKKLPNADKIPFILATSSKDGALIRSAVAEGILAILNTPFLNKL